MSTHLLHIEQSGDAREDVLAERRVRAGKVGVPALLDEFGEDGRGRFGEDVLERGRIPDEERVESEPAGVRLFTSAGWFSAAEQLLLSSFNLA